MLMSDVHLECIQVGFLGLGTNLIADSNTSLRKLNLSQKYCLSKDNDVIKSQKIQLKISYP